MAIVLMSLALAGCQGVTPAPGTANLVVEVRAEPKRGALAFLDSGGGLYDTRAATGGEPDRDYELVPYSQLDQIVVWIEPLTDVPLAERPVLTTVSLRPVTDKPAGWRPPLWVASTSTPVGFTNDSDAALEVYSVSDGNVFELGSLAPGQTVQRRLASAGGVELIDARSLEVLAEVRVVEAYDAAQTYAGRPVRFLNLPPGEYRVRVWHPRLPGAQRRVDLAANRSAEVWLKIGVNSLAQRDGRPAR